MRRKYPSSTRSLGLTLGVGFVFLLLALIGGLGTAVIGQGATIVMAALVLGFFGLFLPLTLFVPALFLVSFVLTGQMQYFARIDRALWLPFLVGALLMVRLPFDLMQRRIGKAEQAPFAPASPLGVKGALFIYFATLFASSAINGVEPLQLLVSFKEYLFLWSLFLVISFGLLAPRYIERVWTLLPWLMLLQLPIVLYQRLVVVPSRAARHVGAEWDAVVGAFGGNPEGGGSSGAMGLFCVISIVLVVARWRRGLLPGWQAALLGLSGFVSIALAEIKFAVLLLPVALVALYFRQLARKPIEGLFAIVMAFAFSFSVLVAYKTQFAYEGERQSVGEYLSSIVGSQSNEGDFVNYRTREMGRVAAVRFWWQQHGLNEPDKLLIGHGAGSSRVGDLVIGEAARKWPFNIGRSTLAVMLWEIGVVGTVAFCSMLLFAFIRALRFSGDERLSAEQQTLSSSVAVALMIVAAGIPYNTDVIVSHQIQLLLMLSLGYLALLNGQFASRPSLKSSQATAPQTLPA